MSWSLIRTALPPRSALATPTPMNHMPSVVMKDGTLRRTWMVPLRNPTKAPTASTNGSAKRPRSLPLAPLRTSIERMTAASVSPPSIERSIEPMMMMKVTPRPSTSGIIAAWLIRTTLPKVMKFGLIAVMTPQSSTRTMTGAQVTSRRVCSTPAGRPAGSRRCAICRARLHRHERFRLRRTPRPDAYAAGCLFFVLRRRCRRRCISRKAASGRAMSPPSSALSRTGSDR